MSGVNETAACPPPPIADNPSSISHQFTAVCQLLYYTTVLFKVWNYKIKNVLFLCVLVFYVLFVLKKKCYEPSAIQYYTANGASRVLRLTLLVLRTNWNYKHALRTELIHMK